MTNTSTQVNRIKKKIGGLAEWLFSRAPPLQAQGPEFNPQYHQKKKKREREREFYYSEIVSPCFFFSQFIQLIVISFRHDG
jgi:hypothetical protein